MESYSKVFSPFCECVQVVWGWQSYTKLEVIGLYAAQTRPFSFHLSNCFSMKQYTVWMYANCKQVGSFRVMNKYVVLVHSGGLLKKNYNCWNLCAFPVFTLSDHQQYGWRNCNNTNLPKLFFIYALPQCMRSRNAKLFF